MRHELGIEDAFAVYRLPNEDNHYLIRPKGNQTIRLENLDTNESAFVFHPFMESEEYPALAFIPEKITFNAEFSFKSYHNGNPVFIAEGDYIPLLEKYVDKIKSNCFHKAICSRVIQKEMPTGDLYPLYIELKKKYPFAFVYLVNVPGIGCWMGATPEVLLTENNGIGETVALAGTRPLSSSEDWTRKEIIEQQMVESYIADVLIKRKKSFHKNGPFTVNAGHVMHLKTRFRFPMESHWKDVAMDIHPTPAICGLPKVEAWNFILENEPHQRGYYCGFLGPVNLHGQTNLFVNLRCMQVFENQFALYVGGGITRDSEPEKELEETRWKSRTLSDIIELVYCGSELVR